MPGPTTPPTPQCFGRDVDRDYIPPTLKPLRTSLEEYVQLNASQLASLFRPVLDALEPDPTRRDREAAAFLMMRNWTGVEFISWR